jgi:uncharacterized protein (DUF1697 family)
MMRHGIAFLRAVNVGGRVVKMERLRSLFEGAGFSGVETFIASGNVVFDLAPAQKPAALEPVIEELLRNALGYDVATFVRTGVELRAVAEHQPFSPAALKRSPRLNVAFLRRRPGSNAAAAIAKLATTADSFHIHGRELYWLSAMMQSESKISNAVFEKIIGQPSTMRGIATIRKMAEKYGA